MRLSSITESTLKWVGPINATLGHNKPGHLNYGTGIAGRAPFLYIPISLTTIRPHLNNIKNNAIIWYDTSGHISFPKSEQQRQQLIRQAHNDGAEVYDRPRLKHLGEAHLTVAQDFRNNPELTNAIDELRGDDSPEALLQNLGLFDESGYGIDMGVKLIPGYNVWRCSWYRDEYDPDGPLQVSLSAIVSRLGHVRQLLGLTRAATLPDGGIWKPHVGIGYIARYDNIESSAQKAYSILR